MADFKFKEGDAIQLKDGRHVRRAFIVNRLEKDDQYPQGYDITYKMVETNQNRLTRWAESDMTPAEAEKFKYKVGDSVTVIDDAGDEGITGKVIEVRESSINTLEPQYAVTFKSVTTGQTDLAWWGEHILSAAKA